MGGAGRGGQHQQRGHGSFVPVEARLVGCTTIGQVEQVEVRYWAALRAAAGVDSDLVPPGTLAEVLDNARRVHADVPRFGQVLGVCSVLLDEQPVGRRPRAEVAVSAGAVVDLLPPFAGGS